MTKEELKEALKKEGLSAAEDHAKLALTNLKKMGKLLVDSTDSEFDDMAYQGLLMFESKLYEALDKIDGEEG